MVVVGLLRSRSLSRFRSRMLMGSYMELFWREVKVSPRGLGSVTSV